MNVGSYFEEFTARDWQTTDEGEIRLALIGLGQFACQNVLPSMPATDFCEVTTLVSGSPEKAERLADEYGVDRVLDYEAFERGEATDGYDAVYVGGPNAFHLDYARAAADHGKHVLCEKPIETTAERAREMVDACESAGVTLMVAYRPQVEPGMRRLRDMIREGVLGDPVQIHAWFTGHILDQNPDPNQWRLDPDLAGGGALLDVGVYPLNASRFLLDADPVAARATAATPDETFAGVDEHVAFQLEFPDAATASCTASYRAQSDDRLRVVGTEGKASIDPAFDAEQNPTLTLEVGDERLEYRGEYVDEVAEEFDYFAHCALTGTEPEPDGWDSVADMEAVEAIYESAETGRRVEVGTESQ